MNYLEKLKEKCNLDDNFMNIVYEIFNKLYSFGYISRRQIKTLQKNLYYNVDVVIFGNTSIIDYKTGYYDAVKKELYIKDINNIESIYLRLLYAITTNELSKNSYITGYSSSHISKNNYKIIYKNFAINRAIISNLACRLLYTLPTTLEISPSYKTYKNNFIGKNLLEQNDIYFLEGRIFSQICYILNVSEENFYINLFINPEKYLNKFFEKNKFTDSSTLLDLFDTVSRNYSNYNKLIFLNTNLNENYLNIRKSNIKNLSTTKLLKEQEKIKSSIRKALEAFTNNDTENDIFKEIENSLAEQIVKLEDSINTNIIKIQDLLVKTLINNEINFSTIDYAIKLKSLSKLLILSNQELEEKIYDTISHKILNTIETTSTNIIEKVKYTIANEVLSSDKYSKIYKSICFSKINYSDLIDQDSMLVAITLDKSFVNFVKVYNLNYKIKELKDNYVLYKGYNFSYIMNTPSALFDVSYIEKIYTKLKTKFTEFINLKTENVYISNIDGNDFVVVQNNDNFKIINVYQKINGEISCKVMKLSENYNVFGNNTILPTVYNKSKNPLKKILSIFC